MIRRITGEVVDVGVSHVVVDVEGVGYLVHTSMPGVSFQLGSQVSFWTHLAVRETALDLYGFQTRNELEIFELLISLPKIGPKSAAQILSQADITLLREAALKNDATYLSKMSGIGKKSAEKIVLGLKEKFEAMGATSSESVSTGSSDTNTLLAADTMDALLALGFSERDARDAVQKLPPDIETTTDAVRHALKSLH